MAILTTTNSVVLPKGVVESVNAIFASITDDSYTNSSRYTHNLALVAPELSERDWNRWPERDRLNVNLVSAGAFQLDHSRSIPTIPDEVANIIGLHFIEPNYGPEHVFTWEGSAMWGWWRDLYPMPSMVDLASNLLCTGGEPIRFKMHIKRQGSDWKAYLETAQNGELFLEQLRYAWEQVRNDLLEGTTTRYNTMAGDSASFALEPAELVKLFANTTYFIRNAQAAPLTVLPLIPTERLLEPDTWGQEEAIFRFQDAGGGAWQIHHSFSYPVEFVNGHINFRDALSGRRVSFMPVLAVHPKRLLAHLQYEQSVPEFPRAGYLQRLGDSHNLIGETTAEGRYVTPVEVAPFPVEDAPVLVAAGLDDEEEEEDDIDRQDGGDDGDDT